MTRKERMMGKLLFFTLAAAFAVFAWNSLPRPAPAQTPNALRESAPGRGMVLGIDRDKGVVTISHEPVPALNMMAMTMGFPVKDRSQLVNLKPMQKIEFQLSYDGKEYVITAIK